MQYYQKIGSCTILYHFEDGWLSIRSFVYDPVYVTTNEDTSEFLEHHKDMFPRNYTHI